MRSVEDGMASWIQAGEPGPLGNISNDTAANNWQIYVSDVRTHPGTKGNLVFRQSLWSWCRSLWQMPQYAILILMSSSPT